MSYTLLATQVPAVQSFSGLLTVASLAVSVSSPLPTSAPLDQGETTDAPAILNENFGRSDLMARYGGGAYAIAYGLALSAGSGLTLNISAGHATIDGIVEFAAGTSTMNNNTTNHVWAKRDGTYEVKNNVLTAPTTPAVYLGAVVTSGGVISSVDQSGRVELVQGLATRTTGDLGIPLDTPASTVSFMAVTAGGKWLWNGSTYLHQTDGLPQTQSTGLATQDVVIPSGFQHRAYKYMKILGTLKVRGRWRVTAN